MDIKDQDLSPEILLYIKSLEADKKNLESNNQSLKTDIYKKEYVK